MAIFTKNKKTEKSEEKDVVVSNDAVSDVVKKSKTKNTTVHYSGKNGDIEHILARPHITEKASMHAEQNVYVFEVNKRANKTLVKNAVKELYKVSPVKVNIVNSPSKNVTSKGIKGVKSGKKKALVYLKKGDTIEII